MKKAKEKQAGGGEEGGSRGMSGSDANGRRTSYSFL